MFQVSVGASLSYSMVGFSLENREQLLREDGSRQSETVISNPSYPDPLGARPDSVTKSNWFRVRARNFVSPYTILSQWRLTFNASVQRDVHQFRTRNINAPFPGTPLPADITVVEIDSLRSYYPLVANIIQYESTGNALSKMLNFSVQAPSAIRVLRTEWSGSLQYDLTWSADDNLAENPYNIRADWARNDQRHRLTAILSVKTTKGGSLFFPVTANSGRAYSVTTGRDDNFDLSINDRPVGVGRNSLRGPGGYNVNLTYLNLPKPQDRQFASAIGRPSIQSPE